MGVTVHPFPFPKGETMINMNIHSVSKLELGSTDKIRSSGWVRDVFIHQEGQESPVVITLFANNKKTLDALCRQGPVRF